MSENTALSKALALERLLSSLLGFGCSILLIILCRLASESLILLLGVMILIDGTIIVLCWQGPARALLADLSGISSIRWKGELSFQLLIQFYFCCELCRCLCNLIVGPDQRNTANAVFCSWMAVGNILGFSAGASGGWHRLVFYCVSEVTW